MANASVFLNKTVVFVNKKIFPSFPLGPVRVVSLKIQDKAIEKRAVTHTI
jgi:hypothetical protein